VRRTVISIDSEKTGMRVELPLLPQLHDTLDAGPPATSPCELLPWNWTARASAIPAQAA
jgi:hypothetical protein